jgi:cell division protein FtsL
MISTNNNFKRRFLSSKAVLFCLLLFLIWVALVCVKTTYKKYEMAKETSNYKAQVEKMKNEINDLNSEKGLLSGNDFLEKEAKLRLNLKKEGEEVVVLLKDGNSDSQAAETQLLPNGDVAIDSAGVSGENKTVQTETDWHKWWRYFFR